MGKKNRKRHFSCQNCDECQYIGEGDYACMKDVPKVVLTEFGTQTEDYMWCRKEKYIMQIIKVRFLNNGTPSGKSYTYYSPVKVSIGDTVQINSTATGVVVEVDVPEWQVEAYKEKIKTIVGFAESQEVTTNAR